VPSILQHLGAEKCVVLVICVKNAVWRYWNSQAGQAGKSFGQRIRVTTSDLDPPRHFGEGHTSECRLYLRHSPVGAKRFMEPTEALSVLTFVNGVIALAMVFVTPRAFPHLRVVRRQHSSFAGRRHNLVLAERESGNVSKRPYRPAFVHRTLGLGAVFNDSQAVLRCQVQNLVHIAGPSRQVHRDDRFGPGSNRVSYGSPGTVLAVGVHIDTDGTSTAHHNATRGRNEGAGGCNHLIPAPNAQRLERQFEGDRPIGDAYGISRTNGTGELGFEQPA